jgi:hypothetical protein
MEILEVSSDERTNETKEAANRILAYIIDNSKRQFDRNLAKCTQSRQTIKKLIGM